MKVLIDNKKISFFFSEFIRVAVWFSILLLLADIYFYFFVKNEYLRGLFNFASEKTPATWVASVLLLVTGFSIFFLNLLKKNKKWIYFGFFFFYLSLDDAVYFHEQISSWLVSQSSYISGLPSYGWLYTIAPIIFLFLGAFFYNLYIELKKNKLTSKYLFLSFLLLGIAIGFDFIDGVFGENFFGLTITHYLRVTEEFIEIISFALILQSVSLLINKYLNNKKEINI